MNGKFLFEGPRKLWLKGVTYGPFAPPSHPREFGHPLQVERDLTSMRRSGLNTIRTYGTPPVWFLDSAQRYGMRVLVGTAWEQHVAFLQDRKTGRGICERVRRDVAAIAGHPAILAYAIGNEIPAPIVRWHGRRRVAAFLEKLWGQVKEEDPEGLVTYVNYPTTEYLELPFLDFLGFNVYLEREADLRAYIARLQNLAGDRPLVMTELGLDARAHGEKRQARTLRWQIRSTFEGGCAGAFVFSWTDEWHRGGSEITEWSFGLTNRDRRPRPALHAVRDAFEAGPFPPEAACPRMSVVVCTHNGADTLGECLAHVQALRYPDYEVIVVDDGSTDRTVEVASGFDVTLISTPNRGLSSARNTGLRAATGEVVAYLDDDAFPDRDWLTYLAATFRETSHAGVGGPNIPPSDENLVARCVARAPGGPVHVLLSDTEAEHIPGCNMAFRADRLRAAGGFDPRFRVAGDDVDVCWRLTERGESLGFNPGAMVWHRRRSSLRAYWRQQEGYGKAEGLLERKWPEKYNPAGHVSWAGRMYSGGGWKLFPSSRQRIYQGTWGTAPFQSAEEAPPRPTDVLAVMPEAWLVLLLLAVLAALGLGWPPLLLLATGLGVVLLGGLLATVVSSAWKATRREGVAGWKARLDAVALTASLHLVQPIARLIGRIEGGLAPWRFLPEGPRLARPVRHLTLWSEEWRSVDRWLRDLASKLRSRGLVARTGGEYDRWDLDVSSGGLGSVRVLTAVEEHGQGRQLVRVRLQRRWGRWTLGLGLGGLLLALAAGADSAWIASVVLGGGAAAILARALGEHLTTTGTVAEAVRSLEARRNGGAPEVAAVRTNGHGPPAAVRRDPGLLGGGPDLPLEPTTREVREGLARQIRLRTRSRREAP